MAENDKPEAEGIQLPIHFRTPRKPSVYASHFFVQETPDEIILSFYEVNQPLITKDREKEMIDEIRITGITAECVARVVVAKHKFPSFLPPIQEIVDRITGKHENAGNRTDSKETS